MLATNQAVEAEIKQAHAGIASQVRGLAEKLAPKPVRKTVKKKKVRQFFVPFGCPVIPTFSFNITSFMLN